ncbi:MAG: hypothetical protein ACR2N5_05225 [Solirubrobacterales bacterium]
MEASSGRPGYELWRPNREKSEAKATKALVSLVLLISAALVLLITLGGWERLQSSGAGTIGVLWGVLYIVFAFLVAKWNRGVLAIAAALGILMAIFAAVATPTWFARAKDGLSSPALPEELLGLLTLLLVPVQIIMIIVCLYAFNQNWQVEEERPIGGGTEYPDADASEGAAATA